MKRLYNEKDSHTAEGHNLYDRAYQLVTPLFREYIAAGFSIRDISQIIQAATTEIELCNIVALKMDEFKKS